MNTFLDGKKTLIGGIGVILTAIGGLCAAIAAHGFNLADALVALKLAAGGIIALGLGGKIQKVLDALGAVETKK